jgi:hypothetical protein
MELAFGALKDGRRRRSLIGQVGIREDVDEAGDRFWYTEIRVYGRSSTYSTLTDLVQI